MIFPYELTVPLVGDVKKQMPNVVCDISPMNVAANMLMNPVPPFDDLEVRRAVAMSLDRKAFVDILTQGKGDIGTAHAALAGRPLGHAGRDAARAAGLRSRRRQEPGEGARDHGGRMASARTSG